MNQICATSVMAMRVDYLIVQIHIALHVKAIMPETTLALYFYTVVAVLVSVIFLTCIFAKVIFIKPIV